MYCKFFLVLSVLVVSLAIGSTTNDIDNDVGNETVVVIPDMISESTSTTVDARDALLMHYYGYGIGRLSSSLPKEILKCIGKSLPRYHLNGNSLWRLRLVSKDSCRIADLIVNQSMTNFFAENGRIWIPDRPSCRQYLLRQVVTRNGPWVEGQSDKWLDSCHQTILNTYKKDFDIIACADCLGGPRQWHPYILNHYCQKSGLSFCLKCPQIAFNIFYTLLFTLVFALSRYSSTGWEYIVLVLLMMVGIGINGFVIFDRFTSGDS